MKLIHALCGMLLGAVILQFTQQEFGIPSSDRPVLIVILWFLITVGYYKAFTWNINADYYNRDGDD